MELTYIMNGEEIIDDHKALESIQSCKSLSCRAFRLYLESKAFKSNEEKLLHLKDDYKILFYNVEAAIDDPLSRCSLGTYGEPTPESFHEQILSLLIVAADFQIPLWLVVRELSILEHDTGTCYNPFAIHVIDQNSFRKNPAWNNFQICEADLRLNYWYEGTYYRTKASHFNRLESMLIYAPNLLLKDATDYDFEGSSYEAWSFKGPWNRMAYKNFQNGLAELKPALTTYYNSHPSLQKYARHVDKILEQYIDQTTSRINYQDDPAYMALHIPNRPLCDLIPKLEHLTFDERNRALSYAILNNYGTDFIEWLLQNEASVDAYVDGEPMIVKAANRPDILPLLLNHVANVNAGTFYGKTSLFYAIQFNNMESVNVLLNHGANINAKISDKFDQGEQDNNFGREQYVEVSLSDVLGFTPLAYSFRYGSPELTKLLVQKGATLKGVNLEKLKSWVNNEERYSLHKRLL